MYTQFYGLKEKPFKLVPDPRFLYLSNAHKSALTHLQYGLEDRNGFVVITGEVGSGKTLLLRVLLDSLPATFRVARIINTNFNAKELLEHVLNEFGVETSGESKPRLLARLTQVLLQTYSEKKEAILVIDEAQNLRQDALEELRMISNLETNTEKLVQIVMVGQPQLRFTLNLPVLEQLKQRITVQYHIPPLTEEETSAYVNHRLAISRGAPLEICTPEALKLIYGYSRGIPRLINVVSDAALRLGYVEEKKILDESILREVIQELEEIGGQDALQSVPQEEDTSILEQKKSFEERLSELEKKQGEVRRKEEELLTKIMDLERSIHSGRISESQDVSASDRDKPSVRIDRRGLDDLFSRVDRLKSDLDTLEFQRWFFASSEEEKGRFQGRRERIERNDAFRKQKEANLIQRLEKLLDSFRVIENRTAALDDIREGAARKESVLESKLDELKRLILKSKPGEVSGLPVKLEKNGKEPDQPAGENRTYPVKVPGRRFNRLIREILKES